jgi:hypothetical protein
VERAPLFHGTERDEYQTNPTKVKPARTARLMPADAPITIHFFQAAMALITYITGISARNIAR